MMLPRRASLVMPMHNVETILLVDRGTAATRSTPTCAAWVVTLVAPDEDALACLNAGRTMSGRRRAGCSAGRMGYCLATVGGRWRWKRRVPAYPGLTTPLLQRLRAAT